MKPKFFRVDASLLLVLTLLVPLSTNAAEQESTLTKVGEQAPDFTATTLDHKEFSLKALKGKPVLLNFFATWCGPCIAELPHVQKEIWEKFKDKDLVVIAIGREHENAELVDFQKKNKFTFPIAGDPKRKIYSKYASAYIPRTYLINKEGKIVYQGIGFEETEFKALLSAIENECSSGK
ncbi:MAG: peroxiredoxin family protein [Limisphaerales bacterium]